MFIFLPRQPIFKSILNFHETASLLGSLLKPASSTWAEVREDIGYGVQEWGILEGPYFSW